MIYDIILRNVTLIIQESTVSYVICTVKEHKSNTTSENVDKASRLPLLRF